MPANCLYDTWKRRIMEMRPSQRITQVRNFVWLIVRIFQSQLVCFNRIAGKIPESAKLVSATRRMSRQLDDPTTQVREWCEPITRNWLDKYRGVHTMKGMHFKS
jgi:hypothetical protein